MEQGTPGAKPIDPGNEPSRPKSKLDYLIDFIIRNPYCTLNGGEGKILVDEILRLREIIPQVDKQIETIIQRMER